MSGAGRRRRHTGATGWFDVRSQMDTCVERPEA
jgi:hypothetical protein